MKALIYNQEGKEVGTTLLPKEIFEVPMNLDLVHQVVVAQTANQRKRIADAKDRSEVRGGGKKPWRQKGTGRARHGSRRSPLWRGGGVTFGPTKDKVFKKKINKKMKRKALFMVLSEKLRSDLLFFLDKIKMEKIKTKEMAGTFNNLLSKRQKSQKTKRPASALIALSEMDKNLILSARNLSGVEIIQAKDLNVLTLLQFKYLIMPKESVKVIKETFLSEKRSSLRQKPHFALRLKPQQAKFAEAKTSSRASTKVSASEKQQLKT